MKLKERIMIPRVQLRTSRRGVGLLRLLGACCMLLHRQTCGAAGSTPYRRLLAPRTDLGGRPPAVAAALRPAPATRMPDLAAIADPPPLPPRCCSASFSCCACMPRAAPITPARKTHKTQLCARVDVAPRAATGDMAHAQQQVTPTRAYREPVESLSSAYRTTAERSATCSRASLAEPIARGVAAAPLGRPTAPPGASGTPRRTPRQLPPHWLLPS